MYMAHAREHNTLPDHQVQCAAGILLVCMVGKQHTYCLNSART